MGVHEQWPAITGHGKLHVVVHQGNCHPVLGRLLWVAENREYGIQSWADCSGLLKTENM